MIPDMKYSVWKKPMGLTREKIDNAIGIVANENKYHPIRDYLSDLVWDGEQRIRFWPAVFWGLTQTITPMKR